MAIVMVNVVSAAIVSPFFGLVNLHEGALAWAMIWPIGVGLHDPPVTLIRGWEGVGHVRESAIGQ